MKSKIELFLKGDNEVVPGTVEVEDDEASSIAKGVGWL